MQAYPNRRRRAEERDWLTFLDQKKKWILFGLLAMLLSLLLLSYYQSNQSFRDQTYTVSSPHLPNAFNGYTICQISDLHGHFLKEGGKKLLAHIDQGEADLIVLTGDLISYGHRYSNQEKKDMGLFLKALKERKPTYYIPGNHELLLEKKGEGQWLTDQLQAAGILDLTHRNLPVLHNGGRIQLAGFQEDLRFYANREEGSAGDIQTHLPAYDPEYYQILLAHNPLYWPAYQAWGADLTISGHMHGGGLRLPFLGGVFSPDVSLFPFYDRGQFEQGLHTLILSAGLGNSGLPFRLFNPMELVWIHLESKSIH